MEAQQPQRRFQIRWVISGLAVLSVAIIILLLFSQKSLVVKGVLRTQNGPMPAGMYDFRIKFYQATTRTDLVYSYDAKGVPVDEKGNFAATLPGGKSLNVATLMQVCIASDVGATPKTARLSSCNVPQGASTAVFNQTICGLTAIDQNPTNIINWLGTKNIIYATPTMACGSDGETATISDKDIVEPLVKTPGNLTDLLGGVEMQPGTLLTTNGAGQLVALPPSEVISKTIQEEIAKDKAENPPQNGPVTNVFNTYPTTIEGQPNTDNQTLALSGNVLSISGGNSVTLPAGTSGPEQDGVIGNEILDIAGSGLVRVGAGTTLDPFRVGLITCANGQVIKSTGAGSWSCAADVDTNTTYTAGTGISFSGTTIDNTGVLSFSLPAGSGLTNTGSAQAVTLKLQDCGNGEILQYNAGSWVCVAPGGVSPYSFAITDNTTTEPVLNGDTVTFIGNEGLVATITPTDHVTYGIVNGGVTTVKLTDGAVVTNKIADGAVTTIKLSDGSISTSKIQDNAVTGQKIAPGTVGNSNLTNSSLTVTAGSGLSGGGVVALGSNTTLNLQACANGQILKYNGTTWACAVDSGDTNTDAQTLSILASAPNGANTVSYALSISGGNSINFDDRDTLYTSVTSGGLALNGTAFSLQTCPVGQLLKSTNAGTPAYACAADNDTDTNTTYTAGTGLSLVGTTFNNTGVLSVTGSGSITSSGGQNPNIAFANGSTAGQFWQWNGSAWVLATLAAEQDAVIGNEVTGVTGTNSGLVRAGSGTAIDPYTLAVSVGNGLQLTGGNVAINSPTCSGTDKLQWTSTAFVCAADVDTNTDAQTLSFDTGTRLLTISGGNSVTIPDANTTYSALANGGLRLVGTEFGLAVCTSGEILKAQPTSGEYACAADNDTDTNTTYSAGTGLSLVGTTFNNTGVLSVTGSGAITSSGGQNPNIAFANGSVTGQFWQWDGDSWELATIAAEQDAVIGNEVTDVTGVNSGLVRSGSGTAVSPYTLAVSTGNGIQLTSGSVVINSPTCSGTTKLQWNGTAFVCSADVDTNTTYTAGSGLNLVGTTFSNTGVLSVTASGALTSSGGQNPNIAFANGSSTGQFWQWNGTAWALATLPAETDAIVGNEVTNVTGVNSGLARSGTGTAVDPYTLAVSTGNGLQLTGGNVAINSPTCSGTTKLQWNGTAFVCSADVDTDTNTTYTADGLGIELTGTTFGLELNGTTLSKSATGLTLNLSNANVWAALQTFGTGLTVTTGQTMTVNGDAFTDLTGTGLTVAGGALQTTLGTTIDLTTEVVNTLPVANGGTGLNTMGTSNQLMGVNAAGTGLEYKNLSSLLVAGTGISLSGTNTVTISNTGAAATCSVSSNYACNGGNTLAAALTLGTNDAQSLIFETNNTPQVTLLSNGNLGVGISPTEKLDVNGNINIPTTTATDGIIKQNGASWIYSMGTGNFFAGSTSGNFTLTGTNNIGIGSATLQSLTSGSSNVAIGGTSLPLVTTGSQNTSIGSNTLQSNTTGQFNTALGFQALNTNISGTHNTASGVNALTSNSTGSLNTATGYGALQNNNASNNTAFGTQSLSGTTSGTFNTAVGSQSGQTGTVANINTTGSYNTFIGYSTGLSSVTQRNYSTAIGAFATVNQGDSLVLGCIATINSCPVTTKIGIANTAPSFLLHVGSSSITTGTAVARFENAGGTCTVTPNTAGGISCTSDERLKKNIEDFSGALNLVNKIDVKQFNMRADKDTSKKQIGVIAQQLEKVLPGVVMTDESGYKSVSYAALAPVVLQAVKEQQVEINQLKQNLWTGGIVTNDTTFKAKTAFEGPVRFANATTFTNDMSIMGKVKLSRDQANQAVLSAGQRRVTVTFGGAYSQSPYVTATPRDFVTGPYRITDVYRTSFVIETQQRQSKSIRFDWHAFSNK